MITTELPAMTTIPSKYDVSRMTLFYLIGREFNRDLNLDRLLRCVLIAAARVIGAANGSFLVLDETENVTKSLFVCGSKVIETDGDAARSILQTSLVGWVKERKKGILISDINDDKRWGNLNGNSDSLGYKSAVSVPLLADQQIIGILTATHDKPGYFDKSDLMMLTAVADQATTAILNARAYQAERYHRELSNQLTNLSRQMNTTVNFGDLFELILDQLALLVDYDQSVIFLLNKGYLTLKAARGLDNLTELHNIQVRLYKDDLALQITKHHLPLLLDDLQTQNTWFRDATDIASRSWLGVPLIANNELFGLISIAKRTPAAYSNEDLQIVRVLASQASILLHNTRLLTQLQFSESRYTNLFEENSDLLLIMNPQGTILDANRKACQILRRPKDAIIGSDLALLGQNLKETFNQQVDQLTSGKETTTELLIQDAYRQEIPLELTAKQEGIEGELAIQ